MKITLESIEAGTVPPADLRAIVAPYGSMAIVDVPEEETRIVLTALDALLTPMDGSAAAPLHPLLKERMTMIPFRTSHGSALVDVTRAWVMKPCGDGSRRPLLYMTFVYDDGLHVTEWVDYGDHGLTLVLDPRGRPALYTVMTSDGYYDTADTMERAGLSFSVVDRLEEIPDTSLRDLVGDVDPARLRALPRLGRPDQGGPLGKPAPQSADAPEPAKPGGMTLRQLYAPPPSPVGRARLGRPR